MMYVTLIIMMIVVTIIITINLSRLQGEPRPLSGSNRDVLDVQRGRLHPHQHLLVYQYKDQIIISILLIRQDERLKPLTVLPHHHQ